MAVVSVGGPQGIDVGLPSSLPPRSALFFRGRGHFLCLVLVSLVLCHRREGLSSPHIMMCTWFMNAHDELVLQSGLGKSL